jgi:heme oxygenase
MTVVDGVHQEAPRFTETLRSATWNQHEQAETSPFVRDLVAGDLPVEGYAAMVDQHWHLYGTLEAVADGLRDDAVAGPFVVEELRRLPHLEADLRSLRGEGWRDQSVPLPATLAYCDRIREVASWPGGVIAHHYTRYVGDLSGGQFIGPAVAGHYGLAGDGTAFYRFDGIPDPAAFRTEYRARLDAAPWDGAEQARIIDEIGRAYAHNIAVFEDLGAALS